MAVVNTVKMSVLTALAISIAIWFGLFPLLDGSLALDIGILTILNAASATCAALQRPKGRFFFVVILQGPVRSFLLLATTAAVYLWFPDPSTSLVLRTFSAAVFTCLAMLI